MLRIQRAANGEIVFKLIGRMDAENVAELKTMFEAEAKGRRVILDLKDNPFCRGYLRHGFALRRVFA